ncbi:uncharacterized protein LOC100366878 [Saccoglossus kowalevskii]|nr:PREDICTED: uncharacterized protein LOC100366878 isoform X2 [Saccoglossus kowalevskii]
MLRFLTQKLRSQSLNEVTPYDPKEVEKDEDFNSGSEAENQEIEQLSKESRHDGQIASGYPLPVLANTVSICSVKSHQPLEDRPCLTENVFKPLTEKDRHSSEEELENIEKQCKENQAAEKRKWSQVNRLSFNGESPGSSDDEVRDLCFKPVPVLFSSSPPKQLQRLCHRSHGSRVFLANVGPSDSSPRKRHRQGLGELSPHLLNRPSLDFEKMQQKMYLKKHGPAGVRARVVKIRSLNVSAAARQPARFLCDPAVFSFRSISTINSLPPVEDPTLTAY